MTMAMTTTTTSSTTAMEVVSPTLFEPSNTNSVLPTFPPIVNTNAASAPQSTLPIHDDDGHDDDDDVVIRALTDDFDMVTAYFWPG